MEKTYPISRALKTRITIAKAHGMKPNDSLIKLIERHPAGHAQRNTAEEMIKQYIQRKRIAAKATAAKKAATKRGKRPIPDRVKSKR